MSNEQIPDVENEDESDDLTAEPAPEADKAQDPGEKKAASPAQAAARSAVLQGGVHN